MVIISLSLHFNGCLSVIPGLVGLPLVSFFRLYQKRAFGRDFTAQMPFLLPSPSVKVVKAVALPGFGVRTGT